jgi:hypothetical protein
MGLPHRRRCRQCSSVPVESGRSFGNLRRFNQRQLQG